MRTPVEIWLKEHRQAYERADRLVEILSPDDILAQLTHPEQDRLRKEIADLLDGIAGLAEGHFRSEENLSIDPFMFQKSTDQNAGIKDDFQHIT